MRTIVVVTGVPGSGKSTLAHRLGPVLGLPVLSLDAIKEALYDADPEETPDRRGLRFAAEERVLRAVAGDAPGAVIDIWLDPTRSDRDRLATGLPAESAVCEVRCLVAAEVAVRRYTGRVRHRLHKPPDRGLLAHIERTAPYFAQPAADDILGPVLAISTSTQVDLEALAAGVRAAWAESSGSSGRDHGGHPDAGGEHRGAELDQDGQTGGPDGRPGGAPGPAQ